MEEKVASDLSVTWSVQGGTHGHYPQKRVLFVEQVQPRISALAN